MRKISCVLVSMVALCFPKGVFAQQPIRVRCGGAAYTDSNGQVWQADTGFNSGSSNNTSQQIGGTADQALYQDGRYNNRAAHPGVHVRGPKWELQCKPSVCGNLKDGGVHRGARFQCENPGNFRVPES